METLGLPPLSTLSVSRCRAGVLGRTCYSNFSVPSSLKLSTTHHKRHGIVRMQAYEEEYELKQMKDMAAARKRWEALIREEKVKILSPREAGYAIQLSNKTLLDVRPSTERKKRSYLSFILAWVKGSTWIPIFEVDDRFDVGTLSRKITNFMMGGWWSGVPALSYDSQFLTKVEQKIPKDTDLIVACQKGLRSLAACELLYNAGYSNLFWVQGGLEAAEEEDLVREGPEPFKLAGIGGLSEFLGHVQLPENACKVSHSVNISSDLPLELTGSKGQGWTDQQRVAATKEGWGYRLVFSARLVGVFLVADALFIGAQQLGRYLQDIRSH
ncbi:Rhodanese-like domain-containing protein 11, chloroplastic [Vitis vinifera]|uniref:Rhodanese-like domain-containing protein 11, chloroplastic n=1 Tax=Vitis vinifera TaxID=29760 RepID=A0A438CB32_VITVI|nr:Rhodanese-like domain-containing protein 11, chloroplastic [Vitis vinifera]